MKVSVLLITFNEALNLPRCLDSLSWCDDIVVVDSASTDATTAIAKAYGARVLTRRFDNFANQRNYGLKCGSLRNEWVLHLDADEVLTETFVEHLLRLIPPDGVWAYSVPSKLMLCGCWLKHAGMYPTYQVRLGHRDRLRFVQVGHGQREELPPDQVELFPEPYLHYNFSKGVVAWLRKHVDYAADEAAAARALIARGGLHRGSGAVERRRRLKALSTRLPLIVRPFLRFIYVYVWSLGFLDGRAGLLYAVMLGLYEAMIITIIMFGSMDVESEHEH